MSYRVCVLLIAALSLWTSCGIQSFEDLADLNPPLALKATVVNGEIVLEFLSYNYEKNFSGFNVFIGTDSSHVRSQSKVIPNIRTDSVPTFAMLTNFARPTEVTLVISREYQSYEPLQSMNVMFWIGVSAYDAVYRQNSKCTDPQLVDMRLPP
ncbi:MAG: hypothetical protein LBC99_10405 [Spirochaetota bacterium]|nr:hypothetical protein [Spirochaetota bacterium]